MSQQVKVDRTLVAGTSSNPLKKTHLDKAVQVYTTCASVNASTSFEPFLVYTTMTGAAQVGGRARFFMTANVALGGWSNALKGEVTYGASGRTAGLGSAICAEMTMSAGTSSGTYAPLEIELNMGAAGVTGTQTSLIYMSVNDAKATVFDDNGFLFSLNGVTAGSGDLYDTTANAATGDETLKICINGTAKYLLVAADAS
uniref:Uncharacterized protein n=1 Tax=viral metagenome TaxID=1070528 RepID=A0A6M3JX97_9ZZZZ